MDNKENKTTGQRMEGQNLQDESGVLKLRYPKKSLKDKSKPDYFVRFWNELNIYANNISASGSRKAAGKYISGFLADLDHCGDSYEEIFAELVDSAGIYLNCCQTDKNFGSEYFGLSRMSTDRLNRKIAVLVDRISITLLESTGLSEEGEIISKAITQAFREQFSNKE